jgi:hypothetical protein
MALTESQAEGVSRALDEATLTAIEVDLWVRIARLTLDVPLMQETSEFPEGETPVVLVLEGVARVVAALDPENGSTEDAPRTLGDLSELVARIARMPGDWAMYGGQFVDYDLSDAPVVDWWDRRTVDVRLTDSGLASHTLYVFQDGVSKEGPMALQIVIWFDDMRVSRLGGQAMALEDFIRASDRWWKATSGGDSAG